MLLRILLLLYSYYSSLSWYCLGISSPALVGMDWRLDYAVRSKTAGRSISPLFFVTLMVKDRGILRNIEMVATAEQMQDLLAKVRDAVKQTDRLLNNNNTGTSESISS